MRFYRNQPHCATLADHPQQKQGRLNRGYPEYHSNLDVTCQVNFVFYIWGWGDFFRMKVPLKNWPHANDDLLVIFTAGITMEIVIISPRQQHSGHRKLFFSFSNSLNIKIPANPCLNCNRACFLVCVYLSA